MKYTILTLFPDMIKQGLNTSIMGKAQEKKLIQIEAVNIRDYAYNKHKQVDDYPYGGGAGMVMQPEPIYEAYKSVIEDGNKTPRVIYLTPQGKPFNQTMAREFSKEEELIFLCGHYEGVDERVIDRIVTDEVSIGDYILTGGELAVMVMIDAISRLIPDVLSNETSAEIETFDDNLLEYPQYTRPAVFMDDRVPDVLLSGHHKNIDVWRRQQSLIRTYHKRPDLLETANLTEADRKFLDKYCK
ncbi:tRNA (guanosine(37)-N1)-methyltransferase TrmD [Vallitalea pronyensis]|uniref:tRNA (guanine-N(1)-)-methyltransferase n=1 Tax=Vallitalea pronyensis TaxID=1348613 RepID=A0A8J8MJU6_9FIRM|nr:tRNA (guanosine(37)-N1)-methyltransferase TrmD [Vallitalea pronyensis]QUI22970.1 tRNA (guanosine(37)-N1)-methyltransferase TrmD [Vallitalea pronyensis]